MTPRTDLAPLADMIAAAEEAVSYTAGIDQPTLVADRMRSHALLWALGVLGEASTRVSETTRGRFPEVPWGQVRGMRNILIHRYDFIDWAIVWSAVTAHLPPLIPTLRAVRDALLAEEPPPPEAP